MIEERSIEDLTDRIGRELLQRIEAARPKDYRERLEADPLMVWSRGGPRFLSDVLRFVDVFPAIRSDAELMEYLAAYVGDPKRILIGAGGQTGDVPKAVRALVENLKARFVAGETIAEAVEQCRGLRHARFGFTLDLLGEAVTSEREAEQYRDAYLELIRAASPAVADWPATKPAGKPATGPAGKPATRPAGKPERTSADRCSHGRIPRLNLSIKLSSLYSRFDPIDPRGSAEGAAPRLRALLAAARAQGAAINVDMEQYALKDLTLEVFKKVLLEPEFRDWPDVEHHDPDLPAREPRRPAALAEWVEKRGAPINVRLVKGAYWDHEVQQAQYRNWPAPVYLTKEETDREFEAGIRFLLEHHEALRPAIASHNVRSAARAMAVAELLELPRDCVEFQTLHGLGAELRRALIEMGFRMRVYRPFGALIPGMAYLVRRVLEVTSKAGFLQQMAASPLPVGGTAGDAEPAGEAAGTDRAGRARRAVPERAGLRFLPARRARRAERRDRAGPRRIGPILSALDRRPCGTGGRGVDLGQSLGEIGSHRPRGMRLSQRRREGGPRRRAGISGVVEDAAARARRPAASRGGADAGSALRAGRMGNPRGGEILARGGCRRRRGD